MLCRLYIIVQGYGYTFTEECDSLDPYTTWFVGVILSYIVIDMFAEGRNLQDINLRWCVDDNHSIAI